MKFCIKTIGLTVATAFALAACGGGGSAASSTEPSTLGGTTAVGFPIVGALVKVTCAGGNALVSQPTSSTGAWQVTLSGQTFPCAAQVTGGTINNIINAMPYHSIALSSGILNVTPLTDLVVANMVQSATLSTWFNALISAALAQIDAAKVTTAINLVQTQLNLVQLGNTINPMTTAFTPAAGSVMDDTLSALKTALTNASLTHANLLTQASLGSGFTAPAGFATKIAVAYMGTTSGTNPTSSPAPVGAVNATTGIATNGTPVVAVANCSQKSTIPAGPALGYPYMRCAANAIANFTVSLVDATDGQTCTANYNNGTLTVAKGSLTVTTVLNSDLIDNVTTFGNGVSETIDTVTGYSSALTVMAGLLIRTSSVTWDAAGALRSISGQIDGSAALASQLNCSH